MVLIPLLTYFGKSSYNNPNINFHYALKMGDWIRQRKVYSPAY